MRVVTGLGCLVGLVAACSPPEASAPPMKTPPMDDGDGQTGDSGEPTSLPPGYPTDRCGEAPSVGEGRHVGTLRDSLAELGGACGHGGPDVFVRLDVPFRADVFVEAFGVEFTPRVGVLGGACSNDWAQHTLACTEGVGTWLLDVAAGTSLLVAVGADPDEPLLPLPAPADGPDLEQDPLADPLAFALDVQLRNVLDVGERCDPPIRGRCGVGTACLTPPPSRPGDTALPVCIAVAADTCAQAEPLSVGTAVGLGTTLVQIPRSVVQTDAHAHSCTGAHRPERVLAVSLPSQPFVRQLIVATDATDVGLALRAGSCFAPDERDCAPASDGGAEVVTELAAGTDDQVFVFIELPPALGSATDGADSDGNSDSDSDGGPGEEAPIAVTLTVSALAER